MKLLLASVLATVLSVMIGLVASTIIPYKLEPSRQSGLPPGNLTMEDVEKARIETEKRIQELKAMPSSQDFLLSRQSGEWITWLPWLLLPLLVPVRRFLGGMALLFLPSVATAFGIFMPIELALFAASLVIGAVLLNIYSRSRQIAEKPEGDQSQ